MVERRPLEPVVAGSSPAPRASESAGRPHIATDETKSSASAPVALRCTKHLTRLVPRLLCVAAITLAERFERKVDRSGEHHLWLGTRDAEGAGQIRVEGKLRTARSVAWELVHGSLPQGARVRGCPDESACVRTSHLSLLQSNGRPRRRGLRGNGSKTMVRPGVWKLAVTVGRFADGSQRRVHTTIHARNELEATRALARFVGEVRDSSLPRSKLERDITVDELSTSFLATFTCSVAMLPAEPELASRL
jgi:hypothetical protein